MRRFYVLLERDHRDVGQRSAYLALGSIGVGVSAVLAFHRADLFPLFGLPIDRYPQG